MMRTRKSEPKNYKTNNSSSETVDHEKQLLAALKILKQCDENELNRKTKTGEGGR